jgi:peptidoglycan/xylan/chitin deacetylase (PgdA/CDA1 family)
MFESSVDLERSPEPRPSARRRVGVALASGVIGAVLFGLSGAPAAQQGRTVAVTIDDGPFVNARRTTYLQHAEAATTRLIETLRRHQATAVLFVNERQLDQDASERQARIRLLERWVSAGHTLGNHTYSHPDANALTAEAYQDDIARGDRVTRELMAARRPYTEYFRHPFTHTGDTADKKASIDAFLAARGYTITPHTIENADWLFNGPYARALAAGETATATRLADAYLAFTDRVIEFAEQASVRLFGREVPQTLLIHTNEITAAHLDAVLTRLEKRGYRFVTLDAVMRDPAYATRDTWVGKGGPTWLFRWSRSLGKSISFADEPEPPDWVAEASR